MPALMLRIMRGDFDRPESQGSSAAVAALIDALLVLEPDRRLDTHAALEHPTLQPHLSEAYRALDMSPTGSLGRHTLGKVEDP